jgi:hypothetical protein
MKQTSIAEVMRHIQRFPAKHKQAHVAALIKIELRDHGRTKRLAELEALAFSICFPQVKKAARDVKRETHAAASH